MNFLGKVGLVAQTSIHLLPNYIEMGKDNLQFNSKTIHGGQQPDKGYGAVMPPVYLTSTYAQSTPGGHQGYEYSRTHNPTRTALEAALASIEVMKAKPSVRNGDGVECAPVPRYARIHILALRRRTSRNRTATKRDCRRRRLQQSTERVAPIV